MATSNKRREEINALSDLLRREAGRSYIWNFLSACNIYQTSFDLNSKAMAFREGERNTGLRLLADCIEANPDAYLLMIKENSSGKPDTANRSGTDDTDGDAAAE